MKTRRIGGRQFERMVRNGLANLSEYETKLNALNVFPVADGDTGTNMIATLAGGIAAAKSNEHAGLYLKSLTDGMLLAARGNSGVILSQLFRGYYRALSKCPIIGIGEFRNALIHGYRSGYDAVVRPVEGTILTVAREGIEHIRAQIGRNTTLEELLSMYVAEMRKSLAQTPELLPELKSAGVIDSGALGYIAVAEGMLKYLYGELVEMKQENAETIGMEKNESVVDYSVFHENSPFEEGYCVEFLLQLMRSEQYLQNFRLRKYIEDLNDFGESIVAVQDESRVKVHIHTLKPAKVLSLSQDYGEFLTCKIENMQLQHNEQLKRKEISKPRSEFVIVSMADTNRMKQILFDLGSDYVIPGGAGMNASVQMFLDAFEEVNAETIVVLPNDANSIFSARHAAKIYDRAKIVILETKSVPQGYYALAMDVPDSRDINFRISQMKKGMTETETLFVSKASKPYRSDVFSCEEGARIAIVGEEVVAEGADNVDAFLKGLSFVDGIGDKEVCVIFRGDSEAGYEEARLQNAVNDAYPDLEVEFIDGGSKLYSWMAAIV